MCDIAGSFKVTPFQLTSDLDLELAGAPVVARAAGRCDGVAHCLRARMEHAAARRRPLIQLSPVFEDEYHW